MPRARVFLFAGIAAFVAFFIVATYFALAPCACSHERELSTQDLTLGVPPNRPPPLPTACGPNPSPPRPSQPSEFGYRQLTSPGREQPVSSPLRIAGQANPFEGAFTVTILDRQGRRIATQDYTKDNRNLAFSVTLPFEVMQPMPACVWVHERSGRDGSPTNITQVPVLLLP